MPSPKKCNFCTTEFDPSDHNIIEYPNHCPDHAKELRGIDDKVFALKKELKTLSKEVS